MTLLPVHTRVVVLRVDPSSPQTLCGLFGALARLAVDDRRTLGLWLQPRRQPVHRLALGQDAQRQVVAHETGDEGLHAWTVELLHDVALDLGRRRGRAGDGWHVDETLGQATKHAVVRAKLVSPLRDAVGLVDGYQARIAAFEQVAESIRVDPLGRDVEQLDRSVHHLSLNLRGVHRREGAVQILRVRAGPLQRRDLVEHQRDQRRDHHGQAVGEDCRQLIAERLAAAGWHQDQRIATAEHVLDRLPLLRSEGVVAVAFFERGQEGIGQHRRGFAHEDSTRFGQSASRGSVAAAANRCELRPPRRSDRVGRCGRTRPGSCRRARLRMHDRPPRIPRE